MRERLNQTPLLHVEHLTKHFRLKSSFRSTKQVVKAVDGVSFDLFQGETVGLAGESGCGKSTIGRLILRLIDGGTGSVHFKDSPNLLELSQRQFCSYRKKMQIVFQDPYSSLNPRMTVERILCEPLEIFGIGGNREARKKRCVELLECVGLSAEHLARYPHEFSGGQRQRIGIARALAVEPELLIADEVVSALDVSVQAQILNLLMDLKDEFGMSYLFISHDLSVLRHISDRVMVMYLGRIVETAKTETLFNHPKHPYTQALLEAIPTIHPRKKSERVIVEGEPPNPINPPTGCAYHPRCPHCVDRCRTETPTLIESESGSIACHLYHE